MQPADAVGEHQRGGDDQGGGERGVDAGPGGEPGHGPGEQRETDQGQHPVPDHEHPRVAGQAGQLVADDQRHRAVGRDGVHPAGVDGLDHGAREDRGAVLVGRDPEVGHRPLGGVGPAVAGEQRRREHQGRRPQHRGEPDQPDGLLTLGAPRGPDLAAQTQPGRGQQAEPGQDDGEPEHPPRLGAPQVRERLHLQDRRAARERRDDQAPEEDQDASEQAARQHERNLGRPVGVPRARRRQVDGARVNGR